MSPTSNATFRGRHGRARRALLGLMTGCAILAGVALPVAGAEPGAPPAMPTGAQQRIENVIAAAQQYLGAAYRVGTQGPLEFDCSGLVFRAFNDAELLDRIGGSRLRAAGYMRWFAERGQMTSDEEQAQRGDLVIYDNGAHIGFYLGDGRALSALTSGVTVHSLHGLSLPVSGFLRPDWSGDGQVAPFVPVALPDVPEEPAALVPASAWVPVLDEATLAPIKRQGTERVDMRTPSSRTFDNGDGTFTTEFHAQPIYYQAAGSDELQPIDLHFQPDARTHTASVSGSPVVVTARPANDPAGFVTVAAANQMISLGVADETGRAGSKAEPLISSDGRAADYFGFLPKGVGLRVVAQPDGVKTFVVLSREPDQNTISYTLDAPGLTPLAQDDGSVVLVDENGASIGHIARPLLLDSSDGDGKGGGLFTAGASLSLTTNADGTTTLTIGVQRHYLDEAVYPAYVDLSLSGFPSAPSGARLAFVSSGHPDASLAEYQRPETPGFAELWLGHQPRSRNDNEIYLRFNDLISTLGTVDIASAALELLPYVQEADAAGAVVSNVTGDWNATSLTWNTRPATGAPLGGWTSAASRWSSVDVSDYVTNVVSRGAIDFGLVLSGQASTGATWQRLIAGDDGSTEYGPRLVVTWSGLRPSTVASDDPAAVAWSQAAIAPDQVRYELQLSRDNFVTVALDTGSIGRKAGRATTWAIPQDAGLLPGTYEWRVRVRYAGNTAWSAWSAARVLDCYFAPRSAYPDHVVVVGDVQVN